MVATLPSVEDMAAVVRAWEAEIKRNGENNNRNQKRYTSATLALTPRQAVLYWEGRVSRCVRLAEVEHCQRMAQISRAQAND